MGLIGADYAIGVRDSHGRSVNAVNRESDSFVSNFTKLVESGMRNATVSVVDINGTSRSCRGFTCTTAASAPGVTTNHIVVGDGVTPVAANDYKLESQISGSVLSYAPSLIAPQIPFVDGDFIRSRVARRSFVNLTDDDVTINEIGIVVTSSTFPILILRDVVAESVVVPGEGGVDIEYVFKAAVGA